MSLVIYRIIRRTGILTLYFILITLGSCDDDVEESNYLKFKADGVAYRFDSFLNRDYTNQPKQLDVLTPTNRKGYGLRIVIEDIDFSTLDIPAIIDENDYPNLTAHIYFDNWETDQKPVFIAGAHNWEDPIEIQIHSISKDLVIEGQFSCIANISPLYQEQAGKESVTITEGRFRIKLKNPY